ncbi:MAG TPA: hypothetical protein VLA54_12165, partial [Acidimicrobiia bacterium]|nr:hypothetical protein [Acidimicrobiia bacterium]
MKRRLSTCLALGVVMMLTVAACGGGAAETTTTAAEGGATTTSTDAAETTTTEGGGEAETTTTAMAELEPAGSLTVGLAAIPPVFPAAIDMYVAQEFGFFEK